MNGSRVRIREHIVDDLESFCDLQMDPTVARHVSWLPRTRSQAEVALLDAIAQQTKSDRLRYFFAVELLHSGEMIGSVGYTRHSPSSGDCGWFLRRPFWGNGYASEAVLCMVAFAFFDSALAALTASCQLENRGSIRVAEKCGFRRLSQTDGRVHFEIRQPLVQGSAT